jgi:acyl-coenzyme A synthetase/AMP-(fatty) acid ligase
MEPGFEVTSLWDCIAGDCIAGSAASSLEFHGPGRSIAMAQLANGSYLAGQLESLRDRAVLLAARDQFAAAVALLELDGVARRIVLCTSDLTPERLAAVAAVAATETIVTDGAASADTLARGLKGSFACVMTPEPRSMPSARHGSAATEWILLTSGTSGMPKLVVHTLKSLAGDLPRQSSGIPSVWSTFYDIRRYGGLQIYLRAVLSGSPLVLSCADESTGDFLARAAAHGVTHISGTPSHWRRALMSGAARVIHPRYVRLSGEVADQALLDQLRATYPNARIAHAFASTEAGVAFDVEDGLAGFPADYIGPARSGIEMKVEDGTLRIRSRRTAARYLGDAPQALSSGDDFVDSGDLVELYAGRYYFRGRKGGVINVGGLKVFPEEVESVLNADPRVRMSLVRSRRNPITGAVVVADVVLADAVQATIDAQTVEHVKSDLLAACRRALPAHKVPAMLRFVPALELTAAGKLVRPGA